MATDEAPDHPIITERTSTGQALTRFSFTGEGEERLDTFVARALPHFSRTRAQALIAQGQVRVNQRAARASTRLARGDVVEVREPVLSVSRQAEGQGHEEMPAEGQEGEPQEGEGQRRFSLEVVFEDEQVLVINKPAGLVVHPAPGAAGPTLVDLLLARLPALAEVSSPAEGRWPGIVHRLDRDTSGLLLVAKTPQALTRLSEQFQARTVVKRYLALVDGHLPLKEGAIEAPIGRDPRQRQRMAVVARGGRRAETLFWVVREFVRFTLLKVQILTGRTHQIRVHAAAIGHPVAGDALYGHAQAPQSPRLFLHAAEVQFTHPTSGERCAFAVPLPADLREFLLKLAPDESLLADAPGDDWDGVGPM